MSTSNDEHERWEKEEMRGSKTGGQLNERTGRVEAGRMPQGSLEGCVTIKDGPLRVFRKRK